jgi:hypothetical protein
MMVIGAQALPAAGHVLSLGYVGPAVRAGCATDAVRPRRRLVAVTSRGSWGAITAVAVSGRSASAISAESRHEVVTEEIDAARMGPIRLIRLAPVFTYDHGAARPC